MCSPAPAGPCLNADYVRRSRIPIGTGEESSEDEGEGEDGSEGRAEEGSSGAGVSEDDSDDDPEVCCAVLCMLRFACCTMDLLCSVDPFALCQLGAASLLLLAWAT